MDAICQPWESVRFASLWSHIDLRVSAHDFGENFLRNLLKSKNLKICFLLQKTCKKRQYGPIAQLGERTVRIRKVVGSIPIRSTISRKITAILAVIFRLTTIIPQTAIFLTALREHGQWALKTHRPQFSLLRHIWSRLILLNSLATLLRLKRSARLLD